MIDLNFKITNPWSDRFKSIWSWSGVTPIKNKCWEMQTTKTNSLIEISLKITHRCDHAGFNLEFGLLGFGFEFNIYDSRHWDYKRNTWHYY